MSGNKWRQKQRDRIRRPESVDQSSVKVREQGVVILSGAVCLNKKDLV